MKSLDISSIKDTTLKDTAVYADSNDDKKLDQRELSLFIRAAVDNNCDKNAIAEVCNQVGIEHASDDVKVMIEKHNQRQKQLNDFKKHFEIFEKSNTTLNKLY